MNILAFDTCFDACSVAVGLSGDAAAGGFQTVFHHREVIGRGHGEALLPMIEKIVGQAGVSFDQLDRIAVTHGPGTFTGTRVGMASALGFASAHGTDIVTGSSLNLIARGIIASLGSTWDNYDGVVVARDARRSMAYVEVTARDGSEIAPPALLSITDSHGLLAGRRYVAVGSAVPAVLDAAGPDCAGIADMSDEFSAESLDEPDARYLLDDAAVLEPVHRPAPLYLRPPDATPSSTPPLARLNEGSGSGA